MIIKVKNIHTKHPDLEHTKPLEPLDTYFDGLVNTAKLYHKWEGLKAIREMDVTSMFPFVTLDPKYQYPIQDPVVLVKGRDTLMPINELFGVMKVLLEAVENHDRNVEQCGDSESCTFRL